ncbi:hypothetical protein [Frankia sp. AgB32]|uniref:TetR/AcrR family transcriptional regulator n=1 Tax=Frankia sp. AgB32 TaxID=631119 RepID=UPI00200E0EE1|nr:hypothetical protein [Frankia sp. AgB32]MCK9897076.1 hypothetical protein [Frankia sp. AgB32]
MLDVVEAEMASTEVESDNAGEQVVRLFLQLWENPTTGRPLLGVLRSAVSHEESGQLLREFVSGEILGRVLGKSPQIIDDDTRAALVGSQLVGLAMLRYIVQVEPLCQLPPEEIVRRVGPVVQYYVTGQLTAESG